MAQTVEVVPKNDDNDPKEYTVTIPGEPDVEGSDIVLPTEDAVRMNVVDGLTVVDYPEGAYFSYTVEEGGRYTVVEVEVEMV